MKTAIIIDSSCTFRNWKDEKDVHLVPLTIVTEDQKNIDDNLEFTPDDFYSLNEEQVLKTSQSIVGSMLGKWDELLKEYDNVICILISKGLSGQYNTYKMFSNEDEYKERVFVVDTNGVSIVNDRQVAFALELIKQGKTPKEIVGFLEEKYSDFKGYIIPKSLKQLVRGGRITKAAAGLAKILKINPILNYNGVIDKEGKARTFKKAVEEALDKIAKENSGEFVVDVAHSRTDQENLDLVNQLMAEKGLKLGKIDELPNVIVCHTGTDTFAFIPYVG
ncbi:DegV family protein [Spiroplasma chinense]|uniref:DegV family protein n=1 Tax=Spiroplasma chinense TaxID=216932 RepID=A0A5B9Y5S4_9MOLU|nr:DegV family protein [Spiroplasma chinense]QEH61627.1 DegV family protein [Spiroplasma chinense]